MPKVFWDVLESCREPALTSPCFVLEQALSAVYEGIRDGARLKSQTNAGFGVIRLTTLADIVTKHPEWRYEP